MGMSVLSFIYFNCTSVCLVVIGTGARKVKEIYFRREERVTSHRRNKVRWEGQQLGGKVVLMCEGFGRPQTPEEGKQEEGAIV